MTSSNSRWANSCSGSHMGQVTVAATAAASSQRCRRDSVRRRCKLRWITVLTSQPRISGGRSLRFQSATIASWTASSDCSGQRRIRWATRRSMGRCGVISCARMEFLLGAFELGPFGFEGGTSIRFGSETAFSQQRRSTSGFFGGSSVNRQEAGVELMWNAGVTALICGLRMARNAARRIPGARVLRRAVFCARERIRMADHSWREPSLPIPESKCGSRAWDG